MRNRRHGVLGMFLTAVLSAGLLAGLAVAQPKPRTGAATAPAANDQDFGETQKELIRLLRMSPTLTTVVARDPSLLANQEYVSRNNPQLAQFLAGHPEIVRNPDFYLFTRTRWRGGPDQALERAVWPEFARNSDSIPAQMFLHELGPFIVFLSILCALIWLIHLFLENRRWTRIFKLQTDVHNKLIDRFGSNQELLTYMNTDAGKRFLEAAPIPVEFEQTQKMPGGVARILTPLQIGIVLTLLGIGFLFLRHAEADLEIPLLVLGTAILMPGIGFILSAAVTWVLAGRLGLMPEKAIETRALPFDQEGRQ